MTHMTLLVIGTQIWLLWYGARAAVELANRDRRCIPMSSLQAMEGAAAFAIVVLVGAGILWLLLGKQDFVDVEQLLELGYIASCFALALSVQILSGSFHGR